MQDNEILPLELKPQGWLHFRQIVTLQDSKVIVEDGRYTYSLSSNPDDENQWIFRYEYRLNPQDEYPHSHLHLNAYRDGKPLRRIHFPTARVSIEQIIAHLIMEHGIQPKCANWFDILAESHRGFVERRTDSPLFP
jgi:hypothetical protein